MTPTIETRTDQPGSVQRMVRALRSNLLHVVALSLILGGLGVMAFARYKIRSICEKYPIEVQLNYPACCEHGGPWPQKTNATSKP